MVLSVLPPGGSNVVFLSALTRWSFLFSTFFSLGLAGVRGTPLFRSWFLSFVGPVAVHRYVTDPFPHSNLQWHRFHHGVANLSHVPPDTIALGKRGFGNPCSLFP